MATESTTHETESEWRQAIVAAFAQRVAAGTHTIVPKEEGFLISNGTVQLCVVWAESIWEPGRAIRITGHEIDPRVELADELLMYGTSQGTLEAVERKLLGLD